MRKNGAFLILWVTAAVAVISIGAWGISTIGGEVSDRATKPLSNSEINGALDQSTPDPSTTSPPTSSSPPSTGTPSPDPRGDATQVLTSSGGSVTASCANGKATLESWSPAAGFHTDDIIRGPADRVQIQFESDVVEDIVVSVRCVNGRPTATTLSEPDDHGDDDGDHGESCVEYLDDDGPDGVEWEDYFEDRAEGEVGDCTNFFNELGVNVPASNPGGDYDFDDDDFDDDHGRRHGGHGEDH